jgi:YcaO-like protein with predicted kinase domain
MAISPSESAFQQDVPGTGLAVAYRGHDFRAAKAFLSGTHRTVSPDETLERIRPYFATAGLTRLANITGLDRIGVPVVLAVRPNGRVLSVAAGKGLTLAAANVSAAMEAIEIYHGENVRLEIFYRSYETLLGERAAVPIEDLPQAKHSSFNPRLPERWVLGWDLMKQRDVAAPLALVALAADPGPPFAWWSFRGGSNGLASGNHFLEALCAGLYEVIERDALACHLIAWEQLGHTIPRVRLETIAFPLVQDVLARLRAAEVRPLFFDCTVDTGVPVYLAYMYDGAQRRVGIMRGSGAHLDPEVAMLRALTEAIQSRAVYFAGSRDDLLRRGLLSVQVHDDRRAIQFLESVPPTVDAGQLTSEAAPVFEADVHFLLQKLHLAGLDQVVVLDLTHSEFEISVVRVIVPGLEGYRFEGTAPGPWTSWQAISHDGAHASGCLPWSDPTGGRRAGHPRRHLPATREPGGPGKRGYHLPAAGHRVDRWGLRPVALRLA